MKGIWLGYQFYLKIGGIKTKDRGITIPPNKRRNNPKRKPKVALGQLENYDIVALNKRRNSPKIKSKVKIQKKDDIDKN